MKTLNVNAQVNESMLDRSCEHILDRDDCSQHDNGWSLTRMWEFRDGGIERDGRGYTATGPAAIRALADAALDARKAGA